VPIFVQGKNAGLNAAAAGLAQGVESGTRLGLARRAQELDEQRYKSSVARALELTKIEQAQEARAQEDHERRIKNEDTIRQGQAEIGKYREGEMLGDDPNFRSINPDGTLKPIRQGSITPQDTAPGYVKQGGLAEAGQYGMLGPTVFAAGLQRHHDGILDHARKVLEKLPPELHGRFLDDVQAGLHRDQNEAFAAKTQSDWQGLNRDMMTPHGAGGVEDLVPEIQQRAKDNSEMLQAATAMPPGPQRDKAVAEAMQTSRAALEKSRKDIRETRTRRLKINSLVTSYQPIIERKRQALYGGADGSGPVVDADLMPTMEARLDAQQEVLEMAKIDPDMTTDRFMAEWQRAGTVTVPHHAQARAPAAPKPAKPYDLSAATIDAKRMLGTQAKPGEVEAKARELVRERQTEANKQRMASMPEPDMTPGDPGLDLPFVAEGQGGAQPASTEQAPPAASKPRKYETAKPEEQSTLIRALREAVLAGHKTAADYEAIAKQLGFDLDSLPAEILQSIAAPPAEKPKRKRYDEEHGGTLRAGGPF
jgi:hypothetical protein